MPHLLTKDEILLERVGLILSGEDAGRYVKFHHDPSQSSGYYVFESTSRTFDSPETFDAWVETKEDLVKYVSESNWVIRWLPDLKVVD